MRSSLLAAAALTLSLAGCAGDTQPADGGAALAADGPIALLPVEQRVVEACRRVQLRSPLPILCPPRLPRPVKRLRLRIIPLRSLDERGVRTPLAGISFEYGAPAAPGHPLWRNAPCCSFHFVVLWLPDRRAFVPTGSTPARLAGRRGLLRDAAGLGRGRCPAWPQCFYWGNHTWFTWRDDGVRYAASLHYFGRERTRSTLARLITELRPATAGPARASGGSS